MAGFAGGSPWERFQIHPIIFNSSSATVGPGSIDGNSGGTPVDLAALSDWISMKNVLWLGGVVIFNDGTATSGDITITVLQATTSTGTSSKACSCLSTGRIVSKTNASTLASVAAWTQVTKATAANTFTGTAAGDLGSSSGALAGVFGVYVVPTDLDMANDFDFVQISWALPGTSSQKMASGFYIAEMKHNCKPANLETIIS